MKNHDWQHLPSWAEWNDNDVNNEKWESHAIHTSKKEPHSFEDPDGNDWFPSIFGAATWKRPSDFIHPKLLCVVENQNIDFDIISPNKHLVQNELMRLIISQIVTLVNLSVRKSHLLPESISNIYNPSDSPVWKPWHHVYSLCKTGKVPHQPVYNPWGKYIVRLFWMGCWRKVYVDDTFPMSIDGRCLLPFSHKAQELWPAILVKALLKVASLEYQLSDPRDFSAIELLTGWMPEHITNYRHYQPKIWEILLTCCPRYEWPSQVDNEKDSPKKSLLKNLEGTLNIEHNPACVAAFADLHTFSQDNMTKQSQQMNTILQGLNFSNKMKHSIYVSEVRTVPLLAPQSNDELPSWKLIRRHLWDENYMNINNQTKCLGLFLPWSVSEIIEEKREPGPRDREFSTVKNPILNLRLKRDMRKDVSKYCETIQVQWINFEDFCKCFRSLCVFHRPTSYSYWYKLVDMKVVHRKSSVKSLSASMGLPVQCINDGVPFYIFSENLEKTEIFISFSVCGVFANKINMSAAKYSSSSSISSYNLVEKIDDLPKGYLIVETFDWQRQMPIQVILTLKTAATKGSSLILPPGRHVLAITTRSAYGSCLTICSNYPLLVGEDDVIYPKISSESLRFLSESENILSLLIDCFSSYGNMNKFTESEGKLYSAVCPNTLETNRSSYYAAFQEAIFLLISRVYETARLTPDAAFAIRVFTLLPYKVVFGANKVNVTIGKKSVADISAVSAEISMEILRKTYFHMVPNVVKQFPFYADECNCVLSLDYSGINNFTPVSNAWLVVFRDVFHVMEDSVKLTPCFHCNDVIWAQHVVDNDTLEQTPETILKTYQHEYKRNKDGYTMTVRVCNANDQKEIRWTLRMVSSLGSLFAPAMKDGPTSAAVIRYIEDYYFPNKKNIIARYSIQAQKECIITFQFAVSSPKVKLEVNVFEEDATKLLTIRGKTEILVPAVFFRKCNKTDETTYTYYIEVKVLQDSWLVDPSHIQFMQALQMKDQLEIHLGLRESEEAISVGNATETVETESRKASIDQRKPFWLLKIIAENNLTDYIIVKKDTRRIEEIRAIKRTWEDDQPGRFTKAYVSRLNFLQRYGINSIPPSKRASTGRSSDVSEKLSSWEVNSIGYSSNFHQTYSVLPPPINTKVRLKYWNVSSFAKRLRPKDNQTLKDKALMRLQVMVQKKIYENFNTWRNGVRMQAEQLKSKQNSEKALLYDTHKQWQRRMSKKRMKVLASRENCRLRMVEEEELNESAFIRSVEELQLRYPDLSRKMKKN